MAVYVIDTIKPKNGLGFPVVEAVDVAVTGEVRLPDALGAKANISYVTSELSEIHTEINQIIISSSAEAVVAPEVIQARIDADGVVHTTLKDRLDYDANTIRENINYYLTPDEKNLLTSTTIIKGAYVDIIGNIVESALYNYFAVEVTANTEYKIYPKARFCCLKVDDTVVQYSEDYTTSFTPTQNGILYVSFYNSDFPSYKMYASTYSFSQVYFWNERTLSNAVIIPHVNELDNTIDEINNYIVGINNDIVSLNDKINYFLIPDEKNLLTSTTIIKGAYVNIIGNIVESALYNYFVVEVTANTEYKIYPKARFCCLKVDDTVVQYSEDYTTSFTPTQNGILYVSFYNSDFPSYKMYNAEYTSEEVYFWNERTLSANVVIPDLENAENNIIDLQDSQEKTNRELAQIITEEKSPNLVINDNNSVGFLQNTGVLDTSLNTYYTTDFIPLEPNTDYVMSLWKAGIKQSYQRFIYMFYNGSKQNLPATYNNIDNLSELSINSSTYSYIRICCRTFQGTPSNARFIQFEKGEHASAAYHDYYDYEYANIISSPLKGKTIYSFGDSIAYGADNGIGPCDLVAAKEGMTVVDYSQSGATISWTEAGNVEFGAGCVMRQIDNASEDAPDFVVIIAGVNDLKFTTSGEVADVTSASGTDFFDDNYIESVDTTHPTGALEYCIAKCIEKWSTAQIIFVTEHKMRNHWGDATHIAEPSRDTFRNLISQLKKVCEKWGVSVLDMYTYGGLNLTIPRQIQNYGYQGTDGTHPSTNGYKKYYVPQLIAKMKELVY